MVETCTQLLQQTNKRSAPLPQPNFFRPSSLLFCFVSKFELEIF